MDLLSDGVVVNRPDHFIGTAVSSTCPTCNLALTIIGGRMEAYARVSKMDDLADAAQRVSVGSIDREVGI